MLCVVVCDPENLMNEEALAHWGMLRHNQPTNKHLVNTCLKFQTSLIPKYRVTQNNVYTLGHEKYYFVIVTTVFIQKQN